MGTFFHKPWKQSDFFWKNIKLFYKVLDHRNVYLLNPRNFGSSDRHSSFDLSEQADDVIRFMYENKISTATLAGHGYGGKIALAAGCYHAERISVIFLLKKIHF